MAAGDSHIVALKADGTVWAWGRNGEGQLGDTTATNRSAPVQVSGLIGVTAVEAGWYYNVALKFDGTVSAWGQNLYGQLGDTTTTNRTTSVKVSGFSLFPACGSMAACNAGTGTCIAPPVVNGTACNDGDACTQIDTCQAGTCAGASPVVCAAPDQCHTAGTCNTATGVCSNPAKANGTSCNDSNACTQSDTCQAGTCTGSPPVVCNGGTDMNGVALGPVACNTTICGGGHINYLCNVSGQWQSVGTSCAGGPPPSCSCSGGTDANGVALGTVACNTTVCGGGYVTYLCNASGQWQNMSTSCSLP